MKKEISVYFSEVADPRVEGRCMHLLSDILMISLLTYLTGGTDYQDMYLFTKERGVEFKGLLQLPNGVPSVDTSFYRSRGISRDFLRTWNSPSRCQKVARMRRQLKAIMGVSKTGGAFE